MKPTYLLPLCLLCALTTTQAQVTADYSVAANTTDALARANTTSYWQAVSNGLETDFDAVSYKAAETGWVRARPLANKASGPGPLVTSLGGQVSAHMSYPNALHRSTHGGIVVITFGISEDNSLRRLEVHTENRELNEEITRQLVGRKIRLAGSTPMKSYTVRLQFVP